MIVGRSTLDNSKNYEIIQNKEKSEYSYDNYLKNLNSLKSIWVKNWIGLPETKTMQLKTKIAIEQDDIKNHYSLFLYQLK